MMVLVMIMVMIMVLRHFPGLVGVLQALHSQHASTQNAESLKNTIDDKIVNCVFITNTTNKGSQLNWNPLCK